MHATLLDSVCVVPNTGSASAAAFTSVHTTKLVYSGGGGGEGISGVKYSEFIAAEILEEIQTWSQEMKVNDLLICLVSVLRIGMKNGR